MTAQFLPDLARPPVHTTLPTKECAEAPVRTDDATPEQPAPVIEAPAGVWGY